MASRSSARSGGWVALAAGLSCASCAHTPSTAKAVLPLVHTSVDPVRWYAVVDTPELGQRLFFVDTGYSHTTCDDGLAQDADLDARGRVRVRGETGDIQARRARLPTLHLGDHEVRGLRCVVRDLASTSSIRDPLEVSVAGVLGMDLLGRFDTVIDPETATLTLTAPGKSPPHGGEPLRREGRLGPRRLLPLYIADQRVWALVDTGATRTYVDGEAMGLESAFVRAGVQIRGSGGSESRDLPVYVEDIRLGPLEAADVHLTQRGPPGRGLIGLDLLGSLRQSYDFKRGRVLLEPVQTDAVPTWRVWNHQHPAPASRRTPDMPHPLGAGP